MPISVADEHPERDMTYPNGESKSVREAYDRQQKSGGSK